MKNSISIVFLALLVVSLARCSSNKSSISGTLVFSDDDLPMLPMNVYAKNVTTGAVYKVRTTSTVNAFTINQIPEGRYIVYAYSLEEIGEYILPEKIKLYGGYTKAVVCGLTDECTDHALIEIELKSRQEISGIKISDWLQAEVPQE